LEVANETITTEKGGEGGRGGKWLRGKLLFFL
jgi:hypothetical protein